MSLNLEATVAWGILVEKTGLYYFSDEDDEAYTEFILSRTDPQIDLFDFLDSNTGGKGKYPLLELGFIGRMDYGIESYAIFVSDSSVVVSEWASRFDPNALSVSEEGLEQLAKIHKELGLDGRDRGGWKIWTLLG
jgi:hypothetical protein